MRFFGILKPKTKKPRTTVVPSRETPPQLKPKEFYEAASSALLDQQEKESQTRIEERSSSVLPKVVTVCEPSKEIAHITKKTWIEKPETLGFPAMIDFSHSFYKLVDTKGMDAVAPDAVVKIDLTDNLLAAVFIDRRYTNLNTLVLAKNPISAIYLKCSALTHLDLSGCRLASIPDLTDVKKLKSLNLSNNRICGSLGALLSCARHLRTLNLANNLLEFSRDDFEQQLEILAQLVNLKEVWLHQNMFATHLDDYEDHVIECCSKLQKLNGAAVDMARVADSTERVHKQQHQRFFVVQPKSAILSAADTSQDLVRAAFLGNTANLTQLLGNVTPAMLTAKDAHGRTALMWAAAKGEAQATQMIGTAMLTAGLDLDQTDDKNRTAYDLAERSPTATPDQIEDCLRVLRAMVPMTSRKSPITTTRKHHHSSSKHSTSGKHHSSSSKRSSSGKSHSSSTKQQSSSTSKHTETVPSLASKSPSSSNSRSRVD